ncbi:MAG: hypothetical protein ABS939_23775, partial [Psychrobacillus sp.]
NTEYEIYAVMVDKSGNKMRNPAPKIVIKTEGPDLSQPYVDSDARLNLVDEKKGIFEFEVSEMLDPKTALDPKNYTLSGTGILNISGQNTIFPTKVEVIGKRVRLTIPALNSLVKNDTIRVTVSKNVLDLAENEFEHIERYPSNQNGPRNEAYYSHTDNLKPELTIKNIIIEKDRNIVEFNATKAGTYYYMILESGYDFTGKEITPRDFVDEFESKNFNSETKFGEANRKDYTGNLLNQYGPAELNLNSKSISIDFDKLNPFKSYSVYMVLKDRAGLLADKIVEKSIVSDTKAPLISGLTVTPREGENNSVDFSFTADEIGELSVIPVKKYIYDTQTKSYKLNSNYFRIDADGNAVLKPIANVYPTTSSEAQREAFQKIASSVGSTKKLKITKGLNKLNLSGLDEHQEYGFYIAADDMLGEKGNFTIFERKEISDPVLPDEPNGEQMIRYAYTDGKSPEIVDRQIVYRTGEDSAPVYRITFSEAINRQNGDIDPQQFNKSNDIKSFNIKDLLKIKGTTANFDENSFEILDYKYNESDTTKQSYLYIRPTPSKLSSVVNHSLNIEMNGDTTMVYDYNNNNLNLLNAKKGFVTNKIAKYVFTPNIVNSFISSRIVDATLVNTEGPINRGQHVEVDIEIGVTLDLEPKFYYMTMQSDSVNIPTATEIINAVEKEISIVNMGVAGKGTFMSNSGNSGVVDLKLTGTNGSFYTNQKVYLISIDKYG